MHFFLNYSVGFVSKLISFLFVKYFSTIFQVFFPWRNKKFVSFFFLQKCQTKKCHKTRRKTITSKYSLAGNFERYWGLWKWIDGIRGAEIDHFENFSRKLTLGHDPENRLCCLHKSEIITRNTWFLSRIEAIGVSVFKNESYKNMLRTIEN